MKIYVYLRHYATFWDLKCLVYKEHCDVAVLRMKWNLAECESMIDRAHGNGVPFR